MAAKKKVKVGRIVLNLKTTLQGEVIDGPKPGPNGTQLWKTKTFSPTTKKNHNNWVKAENLEVIGEVVKHGDPCA